MDDGGVVRLCAAAEAEIADARSGLLAAAAAEWRGPSAERFREVVEGLLSDLVRASRRLEHARSLAVVAARTADAGAAAAAGGAGWAG